MGTQVTVSASQVDKERLGYQAISLTHFTDTAEPSIAAGSKVEIGGALYEFTADETGTGWAGIGASNFVYMLLTPSGASVSWSYTTTAPSWDTAKQGWYTGNNRAFGLLFKNTGSLYVSKSILGSLKSGMGQLRHLPMDGTLRSAMGVACPTLDNFSAAYNTLMSGLPTITKAIRVRWRIQAYSTAGGAFNLEVCASDNNSVAPTTQTSHPRVSCLGVAAAAAAVFGNNNEVDIPLDSSGQFYLYTYAAVNVTVASSGNFMGAVGFYIGD